MKKGSKGEARRARRREHRKHSVIFKGGKVGQESGRERDNESETGVGNEETCKRKGERSKNERKKKLRKNVVYR